MGQVTFQVLDGLERGSVYRDLQTPINIGREEDNQIRLNDERVSRFHAKVQEHRGRYVLTDLESTNGTRVNGHPINMHVLQVGDQVHIGRCLLVFGTPEELAARAQDGEGREGGGTIASLEDRATAAADDECPELFRNGPPPLPVNLDGMQTAQTEDLLAFIHSTLLRALYSVEAPPNVDVDVEPGPYDSVTLAARHWHRLQKLQRELAEYLKEIGDPANRD
ncbi:MAG: FHA domain-containing protein [Planctomycetaceae bacterium]|nr:FHA domain-containing protein [Planctomycetaceae bacterium]